MWTAAALRPSVRLGCERWFPEGRDPRDDDELVPGDRDADIFEVVLTGTFDNDIFHVDGGTDWRGVFKR